MEFDYSKLRGRIVEKYGTNAAFSKELGMSDIQVSKKLNGKAGFSQEDMVTWGSLLDVDIENLGPYFLRPKCST